MQERRTDLACGFAGGGTHTQGKNPIAGWKISGTKTAKKVYDKSVKSYVYCCVGGPTNKMQLPNDSQTSTRPPPYPSSHPPYPGCIHYPPHSVRYPAALVLMRVGYAWDMRHAGHTPRSLPELRNSPNEPHASPPGSFPSAFNRGSPIQLSIETLSRVHTRTVRGVPKRHSADGCGGGALGTTVSLVQPYLAFQLFLPSGNQFSLELSVCDTGGTKRRILFSTNFTEVKRTPLHCQIPFKDIRTGVWQNLVLPLPELVENNFPTGVQVSECVCL